MTRRAIRAADPEAERVRRLSLQFNEGLLEQLRKKLIASPLIKGKVIMTSEEMTALKQ